MDISWVLARILRRRRLRSLLINSSLTFCLQKTRAAAKRGQQDASNIPSHENAERCERTPLQLPIPSFSIPTNVGYSNPAAAAAAAATTGRAETQDMNFTREDAGFLISLLDSQPFIQPQKSNGIMSPSAKTEPFNPAAITSGVLISPPYRTPLPVSAIGAITPVPAIGAITPPVHDAQVQATASSSFTFMPTPRARVQGTTPQAKRPRIAVTEAAQVKVGRTPFIGCPTLALSGFKCLQHLRQNTQKGLNGVLGLDSVINGIFCNVLPNLLSLLSQPSALNKNREDLITRQHLLRGSLDPVHLNHILDEHDKNANIRRKLHLTGFPGDFLTETGGDVLSRVDEGIELAKTSLSFRLKLDQKPIGYRIYTIHELADDQRAAMVSFLTEIVGFVGKVEDDHEVNVEDKQLYLNLVRLLFMVLEVIAYQEVSEWMATTMSADKQFCLWATALLDQFGDHALVNEQALQLAVLKAAALSDFEPRLQWCKTLATSFPAILEEAQRRSQDARLREEQRHAKEQAIFQP